MCFPHTQGSGPEGTLLHPGLRVLRAFGTFLAVTFGTKISVLPVIPA